MKCLNCDFDADGTYCQNCGQKTSTARFSFNHIFKNDIANKFYSFFENGLIFSLKELATRPGHSIREYINGKRKNHMNYLTLYILLSGVAVVLDKYVKVSNAAIASTDEESKKLFKNYFDYVKDHPKTYIFITIPIVSIFTYFFFKKSKFNFSEHIILNIYKTSAVLIIAKLVTLCSLITSNIAFLQVINRFVLLFIFAYSFWFLYQFFNDKNIYSKVSIITRTSFSVTLGLVVSSLTMFVYWLVIFLIVEKKL